MGNDLLLHAIAEFHSPFTSKFGVPKQSGLVDELEGYVEFMPEYRNPDMLRGLEGFSHLWLIWHFSANPHNAASPLVRPPLLGGNEKVGVFASRSPFRPNAIGLSSVKLRRIDTQAATGPLLYVQGGDLMDGTPIFDIKPYVALSDSHPDAHCGFVDSVSMDKLKVEISEKAKACFGASQLAALVKVLELDPRPHYHNDSSRIYGMPFCGYDVRFYVSKGVLYVISADVLG